MRDEDEGSPGCRFAHPGYACCKVCFEEFSENPGAIRGLNSTQGAALAEQTWRTNHDVTNFCIAAAGVIACSHARAAEKTMPINFIGEWCYFHHKKTKRLRTRYQAGLRMVAAPKSYRSTNMVSTVKVGTASR